MDWATTINSSSTNSKCNKLHNQIIVYLNQIIVSCYQIMVSSYQIIVSFNQITISCYQIIVSCYHIMHICTVIGTMQGIVFCKPVSQNRTIYTKLLIYSSRMYGTYSNSLCTCVNASLHLKYSVLNVRVS